LPTADDFVIAMAQPNVVVGDIDGNVRRVLACMERARTANGARVVLLPELVLLGYPPDDLLLRPDLPARIEQAIDRIAAETAGSGLAAVIGTPEWDEGERFNAAIVVDGGRRVGGARKRCLPNYGVFDEMRYFTAGTQPGVVTLDGRTLGLLVCEDLWDPSPARELHAAGAEVILALNASPYHWGKHAQRREMARARQQETGLGVVYVNQVGGQDDLVFDGGSFALGGDGSETAALPGFEEAHGAVRLLDDGTLRASGDTPGAAATPNPAAAVYQAIVLGIRDYVGKNGFGGVFVGLSGGIDSALTLVLAVDALGPERVTAVLMPSRFTAQMSLDDAREEAESLGVAHETLSIEGPYEAFLETLAGPFAGRAVDTTEENVQARCRGVLLMALANKNNAIVLATGNKSEMAVGYATLYGDMAGGYAPLKDVAKTRVYELARWRNDGSDVIPRRVLDRAPSAELAAEQADTDSLPPYDVLDCILEALVERDDSVDEIAAAGFDEEVVRQVARMLVRSEYKRRQAAPGPKVSPRAFGRERRYPITSRYPF